MDVCGSSGGGQLATEVKSRNGMVIIVTRLRDGQAGAPVPTRDKTSVIDKRPRPALGFTKSDIHWLLEALCLGGKAVGA